MIDLDFSHVLFTKGSRITSTTLPSHRQETTHSTKADSTSTAATAAATMTSAEQEYQIYPIVHESVLHNTRTLSNLQSLTASLFGVCAGILGLESYDGFLIYVVFSLITSLLFYVIQVAPDSLREGRSLLDSGRYFGSAFDLWTGGIFSGLSGFILTWTLFYGMVRA